MPHAKLNKMFINRPTHKLPRNIGLFMLCVIGIDGTIGGGIFVLLSVGSDIAGNYLPLSFLLGGVLAFFGALLYAELGTTIPRSGSDLALVFNATRHRYYPFIFSWLILLGDVSYLVINALGLAFYINFFMAVNPTLIALAAMTLAVLVNLRGSSSTGKSEVYTVTALLGLLIIFAVAVFMNPGFHFAPGEFVALMPANIAPIIAGTSLIFMTFVGYEYIASIAEEVKQPARNIPRALMITIATATVVFTTITFAAVNLLPVDELAASSAPFMILAEQLGWWGRMIVVPAAVLATAGSLLAATLVASRRLYALSQQGYFRSVFSAVNQRNVPYKAIFGVTILAIFLLLTNSIAFVAYISNTVYLIGLIAIAVALMKFRVQRPYLTRPFKVPFFPWIPIGVILLAGSILAFIGPVSLAVTALWALLGYFVYLARRIHSSQLYWITWGGMSFLLLFGVISALWLL